jgi:hypothetical protein
MYVMFIAVLEVLLFYIYDSRYTYHVHMNLADSNGIEHVSVGDCALPGSYLYLSTRDPIGRKCPGVKSF